MVIIMGLAREGAGDQAQEQIEMKKDLNQMLAENHRQQMQSEIEAIRKATSEGSLEDALFNEDACEHPNVHPEGFCIDCGEAVDRE